MDFELLFWIIVGSISLVLLIGAWIVPSDRVDITDRKLKEWERE